MPFFDRFWWLRLLGGVMLAVGVVAAAVETAFTDPGRLLSGDGLLMLLLFLLALGLASSA